jgi:hypothetical protein
VVITGVKNLEKNIEFQNTNLLDNSRMDLKLFEKDFNEKLIQNFPELGKYFDFQLNVFTEFNTLIFEINKCLILELNRAAITLTNNLIERLLKLALIKNETGIGPIPIEDWDSIFRPPTEKYSGYNLGSTIEKCKKLNLINSHEKTLLFDSIRDMIRNGFSHADFDKVLIDYPDEIKMFQGSISNPTELKQVTINQKLNPEIQAFQVENFAKGYAKKYFIFGFDLIFKIEERLIKKFK